MPPPADETEDLLARLEAELATHRAEVDARLAAEKTRLDAAQAELDALARGKEEAEARLALVMPRRDALLAEREALQGQGSRGNKLKAALWGTAAVALTAGTIIPLPLVLMSHLFQPVLLLGLPGAAAVGYGLTSLIVRWRR